MNNLFYNKDFDKDVIYDKLSKISEELEKENDDERKRELLYAQMIQGLKLNIMRPNRTLYF